MTTSLAAPVLSPRSVSLLESVLFLGSAAPDVHRGAAGMNRPFFDAAVADLLGKGLVRVHTTGDGGVRLRPGSARTIQDFVAAGGMPKRTRRLVQSRSALQQVLRADGSTVGVERVLDPDLLTMRVNHLTERSRQEAISVLADPSPDDAMGAAAPADLAMLERGVTVVNIRPLAHLDSAVVRTSAEQLVAAGGRVRFTGSTPHRFVVVDRRTAVVPLDNTSPRFGALIVTEALLVRSLHFLATSLFRRAVPYDEAAGTAGSYQPTPLDLRVLALMNSGITDQVAAKDMGVTDRQFRRYVAQVLERLGASSRFQAGVRAFERGWL